MKRHLKVATLLLAVGMTLSAFTVGCSQKEKEATSGTQSQQETGKEEKKSVDWPKKPIQVVVPFKAGGDTDFNARVYAKYLEKELGQPLVIVNVDGNGGTLGSKKVKDSAADGYTTLFYHSAMIVNEATEMVNYDFGDFEMAGVAGMSAGDIITVSKNSKYQSLKDLIEASKADPGKITITGNIGATTYLSALKVNEAGGKLNIVDLGSSADRIVALKGGHVDVIINPYGTIKDYLKTGDFKALGVIIEKRNPKFPDIPTAVEQGYNVVQPTPYFFLFPKGTPKEITEKFNKAVENVAKNNAEYAADIAKAYDQTPFTLSIEESTKYLNTLRDDVMKLKEKLIVKK